jgi:DNA-binding GntR family transcriptional regulator
MQLTADLSTDRVEAVVAALWQAPHRPQGRPEAQIALVCALIAAMGGTQGQQPDLRAIAGRLGVGHQRVYRTLRLLEAKGVVVRSTTRRSLEIRLADAPRWHNG